MGTPRASRRSARAATIASNGSLSSRSYSALRGWNQARSLFTARSARNWIAAGEKPAKGGAAMAIEGSSDRAESIAGSPTRRFARAAMASAEVATASEGFDDEGPGGLVDRDAKAAGRAEGGRRPGRQLDRPVRVPAACLELIPRRRQIVHRVHVDRPIALEVVGQQDRRRAAERHHRHAGPAILDREA